MPGDLSTCNKELKMKRNTILAGHNARRPPEARARSGGDATGQEAWSFERPWGAALLLLCLFLALLNIWPGWTRIVAWLP